MMLDEKWQTLENVFYRFLGGVVQYSYQANMQASNE